MVFLRNLADALSAAFLVAVGVFPAFVVFSAALAAAWAAALSTGLTTGSSTNFGCGCGCLLGAGIGGGGAGTKAAAGAAAGASAGAGTGTGNGAAAETSGAAAGSGTGAGASAGGSADNSGAGVGRSKPGSAAGSAGAATAGSAGFCGRRALVSALGLAGALAALQRLGAKINSTTASSVNSAAWMAAIRSSRRWLLACFSKRAQAPGRLGSAAMARPIRWRVWACSNASPNSPGSAMENSASAPSRPYSTDGGILSSGRAIPSITSASPYTSAPYTSAAFHSACSAIQSSVSKLAARFQPSGARSMRPSRLARSKRSNSAK